MLLMAGIDFEHACSRILYNAHANPSIPDGRIHVPQGNTMRMVLLQTSRTSSWNFSVIHRIRPAIDHVRTIII